MSSSQIQAITNLFDSFWKGYADITPQAKFIHNLLTTRGNQVVNDHIALRTYNRGPLAMAKMAQIFTDLGYQQKGEYFFVEKKLKAFHFEHPIDYLPKVFISELLVEQMSPFIQQSIEKCLDLVASDYRLSSSDLLGYRPWSPLYTNYQRMYQESEYAAWVYAFGLRANHFTVFINQLQNPNDIRPLNELIKANGLKLNSSGGEIKGSPKVYLEQSSTMAAEIEWPFQDQKAVIPSCYYEFAQRYPMPNGKLYQGFVETSADKIFESTNQKK